MKKIISNVCVVALALLFTNCENKTTNYSESSEETKTQPAENVSEPVVQKPIINLDWEYGQQQDKLNGTTEYSAAILSKDRRGMCALNTVDGLNIFSFTWLDKYLPDCYDKILIGMKFEGESKWRKLEINCKGHSGSVVKDFKYCPELKMLKKSTKFYVLFANEEFEFAPSQVLKWNH